MICTYTWKHKAALDSYISKQGIHHQGLETGTHAYNFICPRSNGNIKLINVHRWMNWTPKWAMYHSKPATRHTYINTYSWSNGNIELGLIGHCINLISTSHVKWINARHVESISQNDTHYHSNSDEKTTEQTCESVRTGPFQKRDTPWTSQDLILLS